MPTIAAAKADALAAEKEHRERKERAENQRRASLLKSAGLTSGIGIGAVEGFNSGSDTERWDNRDIDGENMRKVERRMKKEKA